MKGITVPLKEDELQALRDIAYENKKAGTAPASIVGIIKASLQMYLSTRKRTNKMKGKG